MRHVRETSTDRLHNKIAGTEVPQAILNEGDYEVGDTTEYLENTREAILLHKFRITKVTPLNGQWHRVVVEEQFLETIVKKEKKNDERTSTQNKT